MLKELWKFITNLGVSDKLSQFDIRALILLNQVSFIMTLWFIFTTLLSLFQYNALAFFLSLSNVILFSAVLFINSFGRPGLSKNYFVVFGLVMVFFVNMVFDKSFNPNVQFLSTAIFPVLIYKKRSVAFSLVMISIIAFIGANIYQANHAPLMPLEVSKMGATFNGPTFIVMIVVTLIAYFFRNVSEEFERKVVEKNRYLNELIEKMKTMQSQMINSEKMASLGQLTAGIAHEINNPINFVSSNISPLKTDLVELKELCYKYKQLHRSENLENDLKEIESFSEDIDPDFLYGEIETLINGIEEGAGRTKEIVMGLRSFSRIDEDEFKEVNIHDGFDSTLMLLKNKIKNRIEVHMDFGKLPTIEGIPGKLNQVLMNILNNASEAIQDKGDIFIKTEYKSKKREILISIKDNGIGMNEAVRRKLFEPFYTTKEIGKGTGLGLSISFGIIEKHHGNIRVNSKPGEGSEFIITLPVKQPQQ